MSGWAVVVAPGRAARPGALRLPEDAPDDPSECPFCEGREERTPPETFALAPEGREPDTPGWRVRIVPNLFPAFERHEVVVHTPRHVRSLAELTDDELEDVAAAWATRGRELHAAGARYVHVTVNEGRAAGASLPHAHSQLVGLSEEPPAVAEERATGDCAVCALVEDRACTILERDGVVVLARPAGRLPYELVAAPTAHEAGGLRSPALPTALAVVADAVRRLHAIEGRVPLNAWLHDGEHWHIEVLPRLAVLAGLELGAGIYVNTLAPEDAAARLRDIGSR